jgi:DNA-binding PadR family transcriptional regulator
MEKRLLLLGVLRSQEMHGYQLSHHLGHDGCIAVTLTKSNAYKLLNKMKEEGWVSYHEEREGNRPPRRVYAITSEGEAAFQRLVREGLAAYPSPEFPGAVALNYLDALPSDEAVSLLEERREKIAARLSEIDAIPADVRCMHLGMEYLHRFYSGELEWLDEVIGRFNTA